MRHYQLIPLHRKNVMLIIISILLLILVSRLYSLQIKNYQKYQSKANANSIRKIRLTAPRGVIFDRFGKRLTDNRPTYDLKVIPVDVNDRFNYTLLSGVINKSEAEIKTEIEKLKKGIGRFRPHLLKRHVNFEDMSRLEEYKLDLPGIMFSEMPARIYPNSAKLSHALGYMRSITEEMITAADPELNYSFDEVCGASGLERVYEPNLRGQNGIEFHRVDIYNRDHGVLHNEERFPPVPGNPLYTTINAPLQQLTESLISEYRGAVVAMDPDNGEVLVFASAPDYSLDSFVGPIPIDIWSGWNTDENKPLVNRGINGLYPPGSTFKMVAAALIMESEMINPYYKVNCTGSYTLGDRVFHCWNLAGHGQVNLKSAIKYSCNVYFYQVIQGLIFEEWSNMASDFGYGIVTGIDLPFESEGLVPTKSYLNEKYTSRGWSTGNLLTFVIGQGDVLATPLQVCQMMNLIASNGATAKPHFNLNAELEPLTMNLKPKTWDFLQAALSDVVNGDNGTGKNVKIENGGVVKGKTGTSQNPHGEDHSSFVGYIVTDDNQKMTLYVMIENGGKGSEIASEIAKEIFQGFIDQQNGISSID